MRFIILSLLALATTACTARSSSVTNEVVVSQQALLKKLSPLNDELTTRYVLGVLTRLHAQTLAPHAAGGLGRAAISQVKVVSANTPIALTLPDGTLVVSDRLLLTLRSEAQLAFVLAHELGHLALEHHQRLGEGKLSPARRHEIEEEADSFALGVIAAAGYDPRAGLSALAVFSPGLSDIAEDAPTHPGGRQRFERGLTLIAEAGWTPPGLVNRRDFLVVQSRLMNLVRQKIG